MENKDLYTDEALLEMDEQTQKVLIMKETFKQTSYIKEIRDKVVFFFWLTVIPLVIVGLYMFLNYWETVRF